MYKHVQVCIYIIRRVFYYLCLSVGELQSRRLDSLRSGLYTCIWGVGGCHDSAALISTKQPGGSVGSAVTALHMFSYPLNMNHQQTHVQCQNQRILPASCCGICNVCGALSSKQALMEEPALLCMRE